MASVCGNGSHSSYVGLNAKDSNNIQIIGILMILVFASTLKFVKRIFNTPDTAPELEAFG